MNIKWDAQNYTSNFNFVPKYGKDLFNLISKPKGSSVLDLGCGNGHLTNELKDNGYLVQGLDASEELLGIAKNNYPEIPFIKGDATDFKLNEPVDIIFSNAVFHWIDKDLQEDMIRCAWKNLKPGGEFIFEFGGYGNNVLIHRELKKAFNDQGYTYEIPFYFPSIGEYSSLLEKNGFLVTYAILFDRMTKLKGENGLKDWIKMFVKTPFEKVKGDHRDLILDQAVENLRKDLYLDNKWYSDYVRLRIKAVKENKE